VATFSHRQWTEAEDEQIACDAVSFGPQTGVADSTSVFWIRDAGGKLIAYAFPNGVCPQATALAYSGPTSISAGREATLCATVGLVGRSLPAARLPVTFALAGDPVGQAATDVTGRACVHTTVDRTAGMYTVSATFAGLPGFQPSEDEGALRVVQVVHVAAPVVPPPPPAAAIPVAAGVAKPPVAPGAPVARGGGEAVQVQTQPAPQSAQMPQPVVSKQREQQLQPALGYAVQGTGDEVQPEGAYAMSALPSDGVMGRLRREELAAGALALLGAFGAGTAWAMRSARQSVGRTGQRRRERPRRY
jgi:hypothetical protein